MANRELTGTAVAQEEHWIPLSDLMTGLMMFFLLLAITYMVKVEADAKKIKEIAVLYDQLRTDLYTDLQKEFQSDLPKWGAELDRDLTVRFKEPEVLFDTGKDSLKPKFRTILDDFFPRYVRILTARKYKDSIQEIRIEGHTSSVWRFGVSTENAYFNNMALSQARTRAALQYVLALHAIEQERPWLRRYLTANGLSSSKLVINEDGKENQVRSQRVEFRVRTDADAKIAKIIESAQR
jgi:outer membrane protein OmpA-like peptidoglycan-associated protein